MSLRRGVGTLLGRGLALRGHPLQWFPGQLALAALLSTVICVPVTATLALTGLQVPFGQMWLLVAVALLLQWLVRTTREPAPAPEVDPGPAIAEPSHRPYLVADRWERRLSVTERDPQWYTGVVRDRVAALVAERLWQRHGVRLAADPERARAILGDELYRFLTEPLTRTPSAAGMARLVSRMEEI